MLSLRVATFAAAVGLLALAAPAGAQDIDPTLAKSWAYMQKAMPGVPYQLLKDACAEGKLTIYHGAWSDAQNNQIKHFTEQFPCINIQTQEFGGAAMRQRFTTEFQVGRDAADIVQYTNPIATAADAAKGYFAEYKIADDAAYPDNLKIGTVAYPLRIGVAGIAWNTDRVSEADAKILYKWEGAVDPRWAGKVGVIDPTIATGVGAVPWHLWFNLYGEDFIKKIGELKPRIFPGTNPASAALASGDIAVILNASEAGLIPLLNKGAPVRWSFPEPGVAIATDQMINAHAPDPNAARLYQQYAFSLEGYGYWQELGGVPTRIGFKDRRAIAKESWYVLAKKFYTYSAKDYNAETAKVNELFKKYVGSAK